LADLAVCLAGQRPACGTAHKTRRRAQRDLGQARQGSEQPGARNLFGGVGCVLDRLLCSDPGKATQGAVAEHRRARTCGATSQKAACADRQGAAGVDDGLRAGE